MRRRRLLALSGAAFAGFAGCLSDPGGSPDDPTAAPDTDSTDAPTTSPPGSPTDTLGQSAVGVEDIIVRKAVQYDSIMGSGGVLAVEDRQYVVARVRGDVSETAEFTFVADSQSWDPGLSGTTGAQNYAVEGYEGGLVGSPLGGDGPSYLAFEVPDPLSAENPEIRLDGETDRAWQLQRTAREALSAPAPRFDLDSLSVPDTVTQGDSLSVSLTVRNTSDTAGRFLAAVYWPTNLIADDDESHVLEREVGAGETATLTLDLDTEYTAAESGPVTLRVAGHVTAERTVQVDGASTPT